MHFFLVTSGNTRASTWLRANARSKEPTAARPLLPGPRAGRHRYAGQGH